LKQNNVVSLETKQSNYEGVGEVTTRDLVRNALRMRPDRIIIGEVRGSEAFDLLQAMNTGHDGSITTIHANNPKDAIKRLETMILMDGLEVPMRAVREYIDNALDIVVQVSRMRDGRRKITDISEVIDVVDGEVVLHNIFAFKNTGFSQDRLVKGEFKLQEFQPTILEKIRYAGIHDLDEMFSFHQKNSKNHNVNHNKNANQIMRVNHNKSNDIKNNLKIKDK